MSEFRDIEEGELSSVMDTSMPELTAEESDRTFRGKTHTKKRRSKYDELDDKYAKKYSDMNQKLDLLLSMMAEKKKSPKKVTTESKGRSTVVCESDENVNPSDESDSGLSIKVKPGEKITSEEESDSPEGNISDPKDLFHLFGDDAKVIVNKKKEGILIDVSQKEVLETNFRSKSPNFLTAFNEENVDLFPVNEDSEKFLQVPPLDPLIESCLIKRHGNRAAFAKRKGGRSLYTQPCKMVERIAYKGQQASRLGIIIQLYIQQGLGSLLALLQAETCDLEKAQKQVKDIFAMATKGLDQVGRSGAFHHIIRRTLSMTDTGLFELPDANEFLNLPLSNEGVFGVGLEPLLKARKEKKKQAEDLIPDVKPKSSVKRKLDQTSAIYNGPSTSKKVAYSDETFSTVSNFRIPKNREFRNDKQTRNFNRSSPSYRGAYGPRSAQSSTNAGRGRGRDDKK